MRTLGYTVNYLLVFTPFLINLIRKDNKGIPDFFSQTQVMTEKEFLHYEHTLKIEQNEKKSEGEGARIISFPVSKRAKHLKNIQSNDPIHENTRQLDLFFY